MSLSIHQTLRSNQRKIGFKNNGKWESFDNNKIVKKPYLSYNKYQTPKASKVIKDQRFLKTANIQNSTDTKNQSSYYRSTFKDSEWRYDIDWFLRNH